MTASTIAGEWAELDLRGDTRDASLALREAIRADRVQEQALQRQAIPTWLGRMANEYASSSVFAAMAEHAHEAGFDDFSAELRTFSEEERRHGILCGVVAEALGGEARHVAVAEAPYPRHEDAATPRAALLRNVISVSCLSETIAVALIGAELEDMPASPVARVLKAIWSDEIGHARVGWRFLYEQSPTLTDDERASLCDYLPVAVKHIIGHELEHIPAEAVPPPGGERYGLCHGGAARELMFATIAQGVLPPLASINIEHPEAYALLP